MKNIALSLTMTFLFGMFFPSYQAHAKGNLSFDVAKNLQLNAKFSDKLVDKLAKSKTLENIFIKYFTLNLFTSMNRSVLSRDVVKVFDERIRENQEISLADNNMAINMLGFSNNAEFSYFNEKLAVLQLKLNNEFPELSLMNLEDRENIIQNAIVKGNLVNIAIEFANNDECLAYASKMQTNCLNPGAKWYQKIMLAAIAICVVAACIAISAGAALTLPGSVVAIGAAATIYLQLSLSCVTAIGGAFYSTLPTSDLAASCETTTHPYFTYCSSKFDTKAGEI